MNLSISTRGRTLEVGVLGRDKERTEGNWGRMMLGIAIVAVSLGLLYLPTFLELLWS